MPPTLDAAIVKVLKQHGLYHIVDRVDELVLNLAACWPPVPTREQLEKCIRKCAVQGKWTMSITGMADALEALYAPTPRWCPHIHRDPDDADRWVLDDNRYVHMEPMQRVWNWLFCPVCAAPRPGG